MLHFYLTRGELQHLILSIIFINLVAFLSDPWGVATFNMSCPSCAIRPKLHFYLTRGELQLIVSVHVKCNSVWLHFYLTRGELQLVKLQFLSFFFFLLHFYLTRGELQPSKNVAKLINILVAFLSDPWGVATIAINIKF